MAKRKEPIAKNYKVEFNTPPFLESNFATNFAIQKMGGNFKISLFELKPDIILTEADRKAVEKRGSIRADCIGSYITTPESLEKFRDIMSDQLKKHKESKEKTEV